MSKEKKNDPLGSLEKLGRAAADFKGGEGIVLLPIEALPNGIGIARALVDTMRIFAFWIARGIIAPAELLIRRNFGERYFHLFAIISTVAFLYFAKYILRANTYVTDGIFILFVGCGLLHWNRVWLRNRKGEHLHSYSDGDSIIRLRAMENWAVHQRFTFDPSKQFLEPLALAVIGFSLLTEAMRYRLVLSKFPQALGAYLVMTAAVMAVLQFFLWRARVTVLLDERDARLEAEARAASLSEPTERGFSSHRGLAIIPAIRPQQWSTPSPKIEVPLTATPVEKPAQVAPNPAPPVPVHSPAIETVTVVEGKPANHETPPANPPKTPEPLPDVPIAETKQEPKPIDSAAVAVAELKAIAESAEIGCDEAQRKLAAISEANRGEWLSIAAKIVMLGRYPASQFYERRKQLIFELINHDFSTLRNDLDPNIREFSSLGLAGAQSNYPADYPIYLLFEAYLEAYELKRAANTIHQLITPQLKSKASSALAKLKALKPETIAKRRARFCEGQKEPIKG